LSASNARTPASKRSWVQLRRKCQSQRTNGGWRLGRRTKAPPPVTSWRNPSRTIPGAGRGYVKLGLTQPALPCDAPPPTAPRSITTTLAPARRSSHAQARPTTPAPITTTRIPLTGCAGNRKRSEGAPLVGGSGQRAVPAGCVEDRPPSVTSLWVSKLAFRLEISISSRANLVLTPHRSSNASVQSSPPLTSIMRSGSFTPPLGTPGAPSSSARSRVSSLARPLIQR
jgi:hypothetical protein